MYFYIGMEIKDIQGNILIDALVTEQAVKVDELMKQHSITLSWVSVTDEQLPLGAYIEHEGVRYSLLAPYNPEQSDEATYAYKPVFEHPIMRWQHIPFFFYTYSEGKVISKELDWSLTDNPANFMRAVCDAILNETGEDWSYEISADLPASASLSFSNTDIFSGLNTIAGVFKTEWWFDYANKIVYLSKAAYGDAVTLEVGQNIGVPSKNQSKEGYYTRFYAFGSTRNIEQSYAGSNVNSIVNRRLTLNPEKYPNGYIDIREGLTESEILVKTLVFDDIYPRSSLTISDVKVRLMWRLDDNSEKVQIGTDSEGNPVYDQYAIWYFKIPELSFSKDMLIEGKALSVHFNSGALNGREFELTYHDTAKEVTTSDGTSIQVEVGDYEINFIEEGTYIIPAITGLVPMEGDAVTLFNIVMPEEYKVSAYEELEQEVRKEIAKQGEDRNNYTFGSNKVAFFESNPNLAVGRNVLYKNGSTTLATRVIRLETQLDYAFEQKITIGNEQIKGTTQTLKEEVVNANQSIDLLAAINENTEAFQQSLQRTQKAVLDSLVKWGDMWVLDPANGAVRTRYNVIAEGTIAMKDLGDGGSGEVAQGNLDNLSNVQISNPSNGDVLTYDEVNDIWVNKVVKSGLDETELKSYLTTNQYAKLSDIPSLEGYATEQWVLDKKYALASDLTALRTDFDNLNTLLNGNVGGIIDTWNEVVSFLDGYSQSDDLATILSGMNSDIANRVLIEDFEKLEGSVTEIAGYFTNGSANNALKLGGQLPSYYATTDALNGVKNDLISVSNRVKTFEDIIGIDSNGDVYIKGSRNFYTAGGTISMFGLGEGDSGEVASVSIKFEGSDDVYSAVGGIITLPAYPSGGGVADSVDWANVDNKPTTLGGYGITDATHYFVGNGYAGSKLAIGNIVQYGDGAEWRLTDSLWSIEYVILHHLNYSNYALPLGGGTISGPLTINSDFYTNNVRFNREGVTQILTAYAGLNYDLSYYDGSTWERVLTSKNYSSYALPLSGGTISGTITTVVTPGMIILRENSATPYIRFGAVDNGPQYGELGVSSNGNLVYWPLNSSVGGYGNWNTVIHSGILSAYLPDWVEKATLSDAINTLEVGTSDPGLGDYYIAQYAYGNDIGNNNYYRRPLSALYNSFVNSLDKRYLSLSGGEMKGVITMPVYYQIQWGDTSRMIYGDTDTIKMLAPSGVYINGWLAATYGNIGTVLTQNNADVFYDYHYISIGGGSGAPSNHQYGVLLTLPYRKLRGNVTPDYAAQIFIPNGDDTAPYMWFRTSLSTSWNSWRKLVSEETDGKVWHNNVVEITRPDSTYDTMFFTTRTDYNWRIGFGIGTSLNRGIYDTNLGWVLRIYNGSYYIQEHTVEGNLVVTGTAAMGTLSSSSDARLKDNIKLLTDNESLSVLRRLRPSKWNWKSNGALSYGFIAQEVESVASCMVDRMNDEELGQKLYLQYNQLHAFEVGAIQHIDSEVETLKRRVNELENELKQYRICQ